MADFKIITNSTADLPESYIKENQLGLIEFHYVIRGQSYGADKQLDWKEFYEMMRQGDMPTTSQVSPDQARRYFEDCLRETKELLYICFSSGLSGSFNSAKLAADMLMEERPDCRIIVLDSKCASMGEGLLVHKAVQLKKIGWDMDQVAAWIEENIPHMIHIVTVDDLNHLFRGGRVSKATAIVGTVVNIKPILRVNEEGCLETIGKVRGRKKSLHTLVDYMEKSMGNYKAFNDTIFISHGDALEDAQFVCEEIKTRFGVDSFMINHISPTIGAHSGPGTIALFFMGESR